MTSNLPIAVILASPLLLGALVAPGPDKVKPTVRLAKTWESAVAEAKMLKLPLVVHSHGFY